MLSHVSLYIASNPLPDPIKVTRIIKNSISLVSFQFNYLSIFNLLINKESKLQIPQILPNRPPNINFPSFSGLILISLALVSSQILLTFQFISLSNRPSKATFSIFLQFFPVERVSPISSLINDFHHSTFDVKHHQRGILRLSKYD